MKNTLKPLKSSKNISKIAKEKGVSLLYASTQLRKGMKVESEHSNSKDVQRTIALQHLDENIDYYKKLAKMESTFEKGGLIYKKIYNKGGGGYTTIINGMLYNINKQYTKGTWIAQSYDGEYYKETTTLNELKDYLEYHSKTNKMEKGGEVNPDNAKIKNEMIHKSGSVGGLLVGKRHSEGGIKAINKSTNSPLEMEGGEVVITRNAVSDNEKREFEGEMLTNREILSRINEGGGGVSFAKGGDVPKHIMVSGKSYKYGGKTMKDSEIVSSCGCQHKMQEGGVTNSKFYEGFEIGDDGTYKIPSQKEYGVKHHHLPPSEAFKKLYGHKLEKGGMIQIIDKVVPPFTLFQLENGNQDFHITKSNYKNYLKNTHNIVFDELPHKIQMALLLGNQKLVDKYINA